MLRGGIPAGGIEGITSPSGTAGGTLALTEEARCLIRVGLDDRKELERAT